MSRTIIKIQLVTGTDDMAKVSVPEGSEFICVKTITDENNGMWNVPFLFIAVDPERPEQVEILKVVKEGDIIGNQKDWKYVDSFSVPREYHLASPHIFFHVFLFR